jgi:hypothetical protein
VEQASVQSLKGQERGAVGKKDCDELVCCGLVDGFDLGIFVRWRRRKKGEKREHS